MKNLLLPIAVVALLAGCQKNDPVTKVSNPQNNAFLKQAPGGQGKWGLNNTFVIVTETPDYFDADCIPCDISGTGVCDCFDVIVVKGVNNNVYQNFIDAADNNDLSSFFNHNSYNGLFPQLKKFPGVLNTLKNGNCGAVRVPSNSNPDEYFYFVVETSDRYDQNGDERTGQDLRSRCQFAFHFRED